MDREERLKEIVEVGRRTRTPNPAWLWRSAIIVTVVCLGALAIGLIRHGL